MLTEFFNGFVKVTGWPAYKIAFRPKVYYEDKSVQGSHIKGAAMVVSNHTSVFDYALLLFVFFTRTLRVQMAEVLFQKQPLGLFLKLMGGVRVDRNTFDFGFVSKSQRILEKGGVVEIFPESRLPLKGEERPLPFKPSAAYLGLLSGAPMIPVYTNGKYFSRERARVVIGTPVYARELADERLSEKENLERISQLLREKIIGLEKLCHERSKES